MKTPRNISKRRAVGREIMYSPFLKNDLFLAIIAIEFTAPVRGR